MRMSYRLVVWVLLLASMTGPACAADEHWVQYLGTATFKHSTDFAYAERHSLRYQGNRLMDRVVLYLCRDGSAFARKTVRYVDVTAPDFLFEDASNGMREGVRTGPDGRLMVFQANHADAERTAGLPPEAGLVIDAGFDEYMRARWQALLDSGAQSLPLLVPSRQERMRFHVEHLRHAQIAGRAAEVFRLKLDGALGWILPAIEVAYDADEHQLLRYDGLSDLRDVAGNNLSVHVEFKPGDRMPGDAALDRTLRGAPLAPCR